MRNVPVSEVDHIDRPVLAIGTDYPPGFLLARHRHRRAQFLYGATAVMRVVTDDGAWTVPPQRAVLVLHEPAAQRLRDRIASNASLTLRSCSERVRSLSKRTGTRAFLFPRLRPLRQ